MFQHGKKIEDASQCPNVDWIGIELMLYDLRGKVYGCSDSGWNERIFLLDDFAHAQVTDFDFSLFGKKDILKF